MSLSNRGNTQYTADSSRMCSDGRGWVIMNVSMFHLLLPSTEYKGSDMSDSFGFGLLNQKTTMPLSWFLLGAQYFLTFKSNSKF